MLAKIFTPVFYFPFPHLPLETSIVIRHMVLLGVYCIRRTLWFHSYTYAVLLSRRQIHRTRSLHCDMYHAHVAVVSSHEVFQALHSARYATVWPFFDLPDRTKFRWWTKVPKIWENVFSPKYKKEAHKILLSGQNYRNFKLVPKIFYFIFYFYFLCPINVSVTLQIYCNKSFDNYDPFL